MFIWVLMCAYSFFTPQPCNELKFETKEECVDYKIRNAKNLIPQKQMECVRTFVPIQIIK